MYTVKTFRTLTPVQGEKWLDNQSGSGPPNARTQKPLASPAACPAAARPNQQQAACDAIIISRSRPIRRPANPPTRTPIQEVAFVTLTADRYGSSPPPIAPHSFRRDRSPQVPLATHAHGMPHIFYHIPAPPRPKIHHKTISHIARRTV